MKKLILLSSTTLILGIGLTISSCNRQVKVSGLVTYFFNQNFGQKPDMGAEIYFLKDDGLYPINFAGRWTSSKLSPHHLLNNIKILNLQNKVLANNGDKLALADSILSIQHSEAMERQNAIIEFKKAMKDDQLKCVANVNGEFTINLPKGKYYILVVFSHRDAIDLHNGQYSVDLDNGTNLNFKIDEPELDM